MRVRGINGLSGAAATSAASAWAVRSCSSGTGGNQTPAPLLLTCSIVHRRRRIHPGLRPCSICPHVGPGHGSRSMAGSSSRPVCQAPRSA